MAKLGAAIAAVIILVGAAWLIRRAGNAVRRDLRGDTKKH